MVTERDIRNLIEAVSGFAGETVGAEAIRQVGDVAADSTAADLLGGGEQTAAELGGIAQAGGDVLTRLLLGAVGAGPATTARTAGNPLAAISALTDVGGGGVAQQGPQQDGMSRSDRRILGRLIRAENPEREAQAIINQIGEGELPPLSTSGAEMARRLGLAEDIVGRIETVGAQLTALEEGDFQTLASLMGEQDATQDAIDDQGFTAVDDTQTFEERLNLIRENTSVEPVGEGLLRIQSAEINEFGELVPTVSFTSADNPQSRVMNAGDGTFLKVNPDGTTEFIENPEADPSLTRVGDSVFEVVTSDGETRLRNLTPDAGRQFGQTQAGTPFFVDPSTGEVSTPDNLPPALQREIEENRQLSQLTQQANIMAQLAQTGNIQSQQAQRLIEAFATPTGRLRTLTGAARKAGRDRIPQEVLEGSDIATRELLEAAGLNIPGGQEPNQRTPALLRAATAEARQGDLPRNVGAGLDISEALRQSFPGFDEEGFQLDQGIRNIPSQQLLRDFTPQERDVFSQLAEASGINTEELAQTMQELGAPGPRRFRGRTR